MFHSHAMYQIFSKKLLFGKFCPPHTPWNSSSSSPQLHPHAPTIERRSSTPHFVEGLTSTHTPTPVRWVFSLFFSSLTSAHFELYIYPIHQGKNLTHTDEAIPTSNISNPSLAKPIYGFGFWFVEEEHDWFGSGFWGAWRVGCELGFGGGRSKILGGHGGHQHGVMVLWVDLGSWGRG